MKPVVKYKASCGCHIGLENKYAWCYPIDHPDSTRVSNQKMVQTSRVISVVRNVDDVVVEFETRNTRYVIDWNS